MFRPEITSDSGPPTRGILQPSRPASCLVAVIECDAIHILYRLEAVLPAQPVMWVNELPDFVPEVLVPEGIRSLVRRQVLGDVEGLRAAKGGG